MMFYVPKILIGICILGIIGSIFQLYQTKQTLNGSKIRFKRFLLLGVIFTLMIVSSGLYGVSRGNKDISESILLENIAKKYEMANKEQQENQELRQKIEAFTDFYEDMNDIFVNQEERLTDKNMSKLTQIYQQLPKKQQKEYQKKYEQVKKNVQYVKDTKVEEACIDLFEDTNPWFANEQEKKEKQQSVTYERYKTLFQQATNIQNPTKKETALNYLKSVKEWLDQQPQN
ncbi:hypothetical protein DSH57_12015 [Enterococcus faecium]|uniref:hypothetical protein n=1 Tax=Enterococcus TaxID=1350 RepID=UPI0019E6E7DD|nr:hypothetical protein [Enterococcus faecium]EGP5672297.1 hypothetical protein [Enterococcus faecium]EMF0364668.1 hypothetical protein [Enterococcus faecium]EMF0403463.1 hypothetical protein [Enterococcus faecium]MCC4054001.1 hypothetical protein [Enterococcus faecium]